MSRKRLLVVTNFILLGFFCVIGFNNCQPMEAPTAVDLSSNNGNGGEILTGQQYFENTLKPLLSVRCSSCHALPKDLPVGNPVGPLTIFNYTYMRTLIQGGPSAVNNALYNRVSGANHTGGPQCVGDVNGSVSPCREIKTWTILEFPTFSDGMAGAIVNVTATGSVRGWALDPKNMATAVQVYIYVNGPVGGGGTLAAQLTANGAGDGQYNGHYFTYQLPPALADGVPRDLYVYAVQAIEANRVPAMPYNVVAYTPRAAGRAFFTSTVLPQLQVCVQCHGNLDYETRYSILVTPFPAKGGTSTNNELINKMSGENHGGGNRCPGGKNANPCAAVRDWWVLEFN